MTLKDIQKIIKEFEDSNLTELELEFEEIKLRLSKNKENRINDNKNIENNNAVKQEESNITLAPQINLPTDAIKSPLVGTFYGASSPTSKPFVEVGQRVKKGDIVCIIEAMKIMNEITSTLDGVVETINFKNGEVVGFDDVIFTVNTNATNS